MKEFSVDLTMVLVTMPGHLIFAACRSPVHAPGRLVAEMTNALT